MELSSLYCPRHCQLANAFAALDSPVASTPQNPSTTQDIYTRVNAERLQDMKSFVHANGEVNLFTLSDDNIVCLLKHTIEHQLPPQAAPDVCTFYETTTQRAVHDEAELARVRTVIQQARDALQRDGIPGALGYLTAHGIQHAPLKIEHFQRRTGDTRLRSALHVDAEGTVMPDVFYNAATRYGAGEMQPLFDRVRAQYHTHMQDMLAELYRDTPSNQLAEMQRQIYEVEAALAGVAELPSEKRHGFCSQGQVQDQSACVREFVLAWAKAAGHNDNLLQTTVFRGNAVEPVCQQLAQHRDRLPAYLAWLCLSHFALLCFDGRIRQLCCEFHLTCLRGQHVPRARWYDAIVWMKTNMQDNVSHVLLQHGPDNSARREATRKDIEDMKAAARDEVLNVDHWRGLDQDARAKLAGHIARIDVSVGFPAALSPVAYDLRPREGIVGAMQRVGRGNARQTLALVYAQPQDFKWVMNPTTANACYNIATHSIIITEAMTLPPFFGQGVRFIIGHEITHSIDDQGAARIADLPQAARAGFADLCKKMVTWNQALKGRTEQAGGDLTLGENIADLIGFRIALREFQTRVCREANKEEPEDAEVASLYEQYARLWAADTSEVLVQTRAVSDAHEHPATRVQMATSPLPPCLVSS